MEVQVTRLLPAIFPEIPRWRPVTRHDWIPPLSRDFRPRPGNSP